MHVSFEGKTAVVTGGANGIGYAISKRLAASGARVWILDLPKEEPAKRGAELGGSGAEVDVSDRASIDAALAQVGSFDILCANAGMVAFQSLLETSPETWNRVLSVNLSGVFHCLQAAARIWTQKGQPGSVVLTASTNSYDGEADLTAYNASKAGLLGLLHTAANELGPYGIRVNAVCPGLIRTRLTQPHFSNPEGLKEYFRDIPLGRGGEAEEVANAVAFLASDCASFITGATLFVDGGQMAAKFGTWNESKAEFRDGQWRVR